MVKLKLVFKNKFVIITVIVLMILIATAVYYGLSYQINNDETPVSSSKKSEKIPVIYISPSRQSGNFGVSSVGYTNEMEMMNKVADVVIATLKANSKFIIYRNNPETDMDTWIAESNEVEADFHLAIHSNASDGTKFQGMEIYIDNESAPAYDIAKLIYDNLYAIYPYKSAETNHGILYLPFREVRVDKVKCGALLEIAYHDNKDDAKWIVNNIDKIGNNIAYSIIEYFK